MCSCKSLANTSKSRLGPTLPVAAFQLQLSFLGVTSSTVLALLWLHPGAPPTVCLQGTWPGQLSVSSISCRECGRQGACSVRIAGTDGHPESFPWGGKVQCTPRSMPHRAFHSGVARLLGGLRSRRVVFQVKAINIGMQQLFSHTSGCPAAARSWVKHCSVPPALPSPALTHLCMWLRGSDPRPGCRVHDRRLPLHQEEVGARVLRTHPHVWVPGLRAPPRPALPGLRLLGA